jgi:hypothetical protein
LSVARDSLDTHDVAIITAQRVLVAAAADAVAALVVTLDDFHPNVL